ncbi:hypothetical protein BDZ85DRAFT_280709 [Elsinoe ampelina]|uniref:SRR1-like domain-containing protein n=1 Tax=Elsinoe ampelina TaxID=302913 RepID=A0A6A6GEM9_9PEZI|nr:hypothetical protein BDZ85DRAFT_280709 [Elsinoe ampelina]
MPHTARKNKNKHPGKLITIPAPVPIPIPVSGDGAGEGEGEAEQGWSKVVRSNAARGRRGGQAGRGGEGHRIEPGPPRNVTGATVGELRRGSLWQLAVFMVIVDDMGRHSGGDITLEVRDPAFSTTDTKFLESLGFKVLSLEDKLVTDQHTFLFVPFLDFRYEAAILVHAETCPVYVSSGLKGTESYLEGLERSSKGSEDEVFSSDLSTEEIKTNLQAAKRMQQSHSSLGFPEVPNSGHAFTGLRIHLLQHAD